MNKIKNQKGAISLFVLLSMLFFLAFILGTYTLVSRRNAVQVEALKETQEIYKSGSTSKDIYDSILAPTDAVIPIATKEQLAKVIEINNSTDINIRASYIIDGKLYTYRKSPDPNKKIPYYLKNDIILDLKSEIDGKKDITIYDYILYSNDYNIDMNGHDIYYAQTDGSLWKCICYQNLGDTTNPKLFSTDNRSSNYYGKSASPNLYSILENGVDKYQKVWNADTNSNFEFMLMYNCYSGKFNSSKYNRWRQTNNPAKDDIKDETDTALAEKAVAPGYTIDFTGGTTAGLGTGFYWGGLTHSTVPEKCYLDGSVGHDKWHYAVATTVLWTHPDATVQGIPVSTIDETEGRANAALESLLFVRAR